MGFLDKVVKGVESGVSRAQFEADKVMKVNALKGEVDKAKRERHDLLAEIGEEAVSLFASHEIALPGLDMQLARLSDLTELLKKKEAELAAAEAMQFTAAPATVASSPAPEPTPTPASASETEPTPAVPVEPAAGRPAFCPNCGAKLPPSGAFCPECGTKI